MRVVIAGTGALACLFGARLAPHADVILLGTWAEGIAAINARGVVVEAAEKDEGLVSPGPPSAPRQVRATSNPAEAAPADLAFVLVKAWQTERAAGQLAECLAPHGVAVTVQNGLGNIEALQERLGRNRSALGVTMQGATLLGPGRVREGGAGAVHLGRHPRIEPAHRLLAAAGFETHVVDDVQGLAWGKLVVNAGINALTALLRVPNGALLERPAALELMDAAAREAAAVAEANSIRLPFADPVAQTRQVARRTAGNFSSMHQDVQRGARTEIDAINGAVCREGELAGVPTPVNRVLWQLVRALGTEEALPVAVNAGSRV